MSILDKYLKRKENPQPKWKLRHIKMCLILAMFAVWWCEFDKYPILPEQQSRDWTQKVDLWDLSDISLPNDTATVYQLIDWWLTKSEIEAFFGLPSQDQDVMAYINFIKTIQQYITNTDDMSVFLSKNSNDLTKIVSDAVRFKRDWHNDNSIRLLLWMWEYSLQDHLIIRTKYKNQFPSVTLSHIKDMIEYGIIDTSKQYEDDFLTESLNITNILAKCWFENPTRVLTEHTNDSIIDQVLYVKISRIQQITQKVFWLPDDVLISISQNTNNTIQEWIDALIEVCGDDQVLTVRERWTINHIFMINTDNDNFDVQQFLTKYRLFDEQLGWMIQHRPLQIDQYPNQERQYYYNILKIFQSTKPIVLASCLADENFRKFVSTKQGTNIFFDYVVGIRDEQTLIETMLHISYLKSEFFDDVDIDTYIIKAMSKSKLTKSDRKIVSDILKTQYPEGKSEYEDLLFLLADEFDYDMCDRSLRDFVLEIIALSKENEALTFYDWLIHVPFSRLKIAFWSVYYDIPYSEFVALSKYKADQNHLKSLLEARGKILTDSLSQEYHQYVEMKQKLKDGVLHGVRRLDDENHAFVWYYEDVCKDLFQHPHIYSLYDFLSSNEDESWTSNISVVVDGVTITIPVSSQNPNSKYSFGLFQALLHTADELYRYDKIPDRNIVLEKLHQKIHQYLQYADYMETQKDNTTIFILYPDRAQDHNGAFFWKSDRLKTAYQNLWYTDVKDFSLNTKSAVSFLDFVKMVDDFQKETWRYVIVEFGAHGWEQYTTYSHSLWWNIDNIYFEKLFDMWGLDGWRFFLLNIESCNSWYKWDPKSPNNVPNIVCDSRNQISPNTNPHINYLLWDKQPSDHPNAQRTWQVPPRSPYPPHRAMFWAFITQYGSLWDFNFWNPQKQKPDEFTDSGDVDVFRRKPWQSPVSSYPFALKPKLKNTA